MKVGIMTHPVFAALPDTQQIRARRAACLPLRSSLMAAVAVKPRGVGRQIVRDRVLRFNAEGPDGLLQRSRSGRPARLNEARLAALIARVETGPLPAIDGVVRWRLQDLAQWLWEDYRLSISESCLSATLRKHGYRKLTARPRHHGQNGHEIDAFKKTSPP